MADDCHIVVAHKDSLTTEGLLEQVPGGRFHIMRREDFDGVVYPGDLAIIDDTESTLAWLRGKMSDGLLPKELDIYCLHYGEGSFPKVIDGIVHCRPKQLLGYVPYYASTSHRV
jgi:hypothetical protein